jgi:hypothetical protein
MGSDVGHQDAAQRVHDNDREPANHYLEFRTAQGSSKRASFRDLRKANT